jgi:protein-serine/threonine kinase
MPEAWAKLLQNSGITRDEKKKNPQAVVDVLRFYTKRSSQNEEDSKFLTAQRYGMFSPLFMC